MTTASIHPAPAPVAVRQPARPTLARLLAACRLEDGARWALVGALAGAAILALLIV